ncbi:MAG: alpha/beta fold hydrolase, partial [Alphaproteobacteria bacterium]
MMRRLLALLAILLAAPAAAADYPKPQEGDWVAKDFRFHTGEVMPELKLHYRTIGDPRNPVVLMLHGTTGSGASLLTPGFAGELFGTGQPLDAARYFIVLPDGIGHGQSSKPSDGLRTKFPQYDYADMVDAHYRLLTEVDAHHRLLTEGLGIKHVRLVMGNSMGGMNAWLWAGKYPDFMDAAVPMASQPTPMAARNWMMRRLIIDSIRSDPDWNGGNYTSQPKSVKRAAVFYATATSGGTLAYAALAPTRDAADKLLDERLAAPFNADANDYLYQWESSSDYDPTPLLPRISAKL